LKFKCSLFICLIQKFSTIFKGSTGIKQRLGGIKSRLGVKLTNQVGSVTLENNEKLEVYDCLDQDQNSEEDLLRANAIKTIDLRKRLAHKTQVCISCTLTASN
jgi:hypothetical protein